jgi:hypothetical protein
MVFGANHTRSHFSAHRITPSSLGMSFFRLLSKGALPYVAADELINIADISLRVNLGTMGEFGGILPADGW